MDIHKPKPVHSLREFLSEILVVVAGIAIALPGDPDEREALSAGGGAELGGARYG